MDTQYGKTYSYEDINNINYFEDGKYHIVTREDVFLYVGLLKNDYEAETLVNLYGCLEDPTLVNNGWFLISKELNVFSNEVGDGGLISAIPLSAGFTGVMIQPLDEDTAFKLIIREFFPPNKFRTINPMQLALK